MQFVRAGMDFPPKQVRLSTEQGVKQSLMRVVVYRRSFFLTSPGFGFYPYQPVKKSRIVKRIESIL